jgi:hypothetical protein
MPYFYRLESCWSEWARYFETNGHRYVGARKVDMTEQHGFVRETACGLWMFASFADALRFQQSEPNFPMNEIANNAVGCLRGVGDPDKCLRFCIRIAAEAFDENIFRDIPLAAVYPSGVFHAWFAGEGEAYRGGRLIDGEQLGDLFIEIFFAGRWYQKSPPLGQALRTRVLLDGSVDGFLLDLPSQNCPPGHLGQILEG